MRASPRDAGPLPSVGGCGDREPLDPPAKDTDPFGRGARASACPLAREDGVDGSGARMTVLRLPVAPPFAHETVFRMLAAHAIPGVERVDNGEMTLTRLLPVGDGQVRGELAVRKRHVRVTVDAADDACPGLVDSIRRWLDLDADAERIDAALGADALLAPLVAARPGIRVVGYLDEFEAVACTIMGQQVSLRAARTFAGRLSAAFGDAVGDLRAFPSAARIARCSPASLGKTVGLTRRRAETLHRVAVLWASGATLSGEPSDVRRRLLSVSGIGPWTVDYLMVRAAKDPNTFASGDLVARRALGMTAREAARRAEAWAPYRSYALVHLWAATAYAVTERAGASFVATN